MLLWVDLLVHANPICNRHFQMEDLNGHKVAEVGDDGIHLKLAKMDTR